MDLKVRKEGKKEERREGGKEGKRRKGGKRESGRTNELRKLTGDKLIFYILLFLCISFLSNGHYFLDL